MGSYKEHQNILKKFKVLVCRELPEVRIFDRHVGLLYTKNGVPVTVNMKGMADAYGLITVNSSLIHLEFEVKSGKSRQSKEQKIWQEFIERKKGIYILVRNPEDGLKELREKLGLMKNASKS